MGCLCSRPQDVSNNRVGREANERQSKAEASQAPADPGAHLAFKDTKLIALFDGSTLASLQKPLLSKHLNKTLAQINHHYKKTLSVRLNEFKPERVLMEAIVKKFRQYGWFVALFEYGINPIGPG